MEKKFMNLRIMWMIGQVRIISINYRQKKLKEELGWSAHIGLSSGLKNVDIWLQKNINVIEGMEREYRHKK
jgi:hypothetical protein